MKLRRTKIVPFLGPPGMFYPTAYSSCRLIRRCPRVRITIRKYTYTEWAKKYAVVLRVVTSSMHQFHY